MLFRSIEDKINELERRMPIVGDLEFLHHRIDWRPLWELMSEIQSEFKSERFSSRSEQQRLWNWFDKLRAEARTLRTKESNLYVQRSEKYREFVRQDIAKAYLDELGGTIDRALFGGPSRELLKSLGQHLKDAREHLKEYWPNLTREDRATLRSEIEYVQAQHNAWWERAKAASAARQLEFQERKIAYERRSAENQERRREIRERVEQNLSKNLQKLENAEAAQERCEARISALEEEIYQSTSQKWTEIKSNWLEEAKEKLSRIEESIDRIKAWINQDNERLSSL